MTNKFHVDKLWNCVCYFSFLWDNNNTKFVKHKLTVLRSMLLPPKNKSEAWTVYEGQENKHIKKVMVPMCYWGGTWSFEL